MNTVPELQRVLTAPPIRDLPTDLAKRYQAKLEGYRADFEPRGTLENDLVAEMAHLVLQLEQTRAVAAALVAIRVETAAAEAVERQAGAAAVVGQGSCRDDRDARLAALHLQTLAFDATPEGERLRRHYGACERALHRLIATFLKLRKAAAIAGCNTTETEREYAGTAPVDPRPSASCSPSQEQWQPYAPVHEPSNGHPAAPANRQFNSTPGDAGPDGVVTPSAVIADGPAGYNDGTTPGRAGAFASAPHTAGSNEEDDERDPGYNTDAAFKLVLEAAVANQRQPKTASKRLELGLLERAIVAQAKEIHRLELFEQARDDFYNRRGTQPFSRKPWHPDPRLTGELPPYRDSRIECNGRNS